MKKLSELTDRELAEWNYQMIDRCERHLSFIATYYKVVIAFAVIAMTAFAVIEYLALQEVK